MAYLTTQMKLPFQINEIITIHYFEYAKNFCFLGEEHNFWEFLYVDRGCVEVRAADKTVILKTGDMIFHEPMEFHALKAIQGTAPDLVVASFVCTSPEMDRLRRGLFHIDDTEKVLLSKIIMEARSAFSTPLNLPSVEQVQRSPQSEFGSEQLICIYLEELLIQLCRKQAHLPVVQAALLPAGASPSAAVSSSKEREQLNRIFEYLKCHVSERLTVPQISAAVLISRSCMQQLFHKSMNCGIMQYFNRMKISVAKQLIREGKRNFSEIAECLSFSNASYFTQCFRRETGMTPMEYAQSVSSISNALSHRGLAEKETAAVTAANETGPK
ncbi:MAG: AraC family transcriptional regulator [Oscillospiraceae bacterium]|jgi:AraC-like DNA-binding protein|nr:AraC family transcriptional regulator [Oscillospiraceae bacterium]